MSKKVLFFIKIKPARYVRKSDQQCPDTEFDETDIISLVNSYLDKGDYKPHYDSIKYAFNENQLFIEGTAYIVEDYRDIEVLVRRLKKRATNKVSYP